jgi:alpha-aminoadipate carrier protein LysW
MISCSVCDAEIDIDEDELDEGDTITCDECGAELRVVGVDPLELEALEEEEEDDSDLGSDDEEEGDEQWK